MGSLKIGWWFPAVMAGSTLGVTGCASRTFDFGFDTEAGDGSGSGSDSDTGGVPITSDPTTPTNPTDPTSDPTTPTNPTDPTTDPTDPTSDPSQPPQLIDVRFLDNLTLQLTFSEAMQSVEAVDPTIFRLSMAFGATEDYYGDNPMTFYQEVGYSIQDPYCYDRYCYERCYYDDESGGNCYDYCYDYCPYQSQQVQVFDARNDSADPTKIILSLDRGITNSVCSIFGEVPPEFTGGLFLHYTDERPPLPMDTEGQGLFPIGKHWVDNPDGSVQVEGFFPQLNPMLPIPCPF